MHLSASLLVLLQCLSRPQHATSIPHLIPLAAKIVYPPHSNPILTQCIWNPHFFFVSLYYHMPASTPRLIQVAAEQPENLPAYSFTPFHTRTPHALTHTHAHAHAHACLLTSLTVFHSHVTFISCRRRFRRSAPRGTRVPF